MRKILGFTCLLFLLSGFAFADGLPAGDPMMQVDDPTCTPTAANTQTISAGASGGQLESFTSTDGSGCFGFQISPNSASFFTLDIQVDAFFIPDAVNCTSNKFTCNVTNLDDGTVTDMFFTENICEVCSTGFPAGDFFAVDLSPGGWGANTFYIEANLSTPADNPNLSQQFTAPEPSSVFLLGTGVAGLMGLRKRMSSTAKATLNSKIT